MSNQLPHDTVVPSKDSSLGKKEQVADMFDRIAYRYDFLNRFLSGGIDIWWRRRAISQLKEIKPQIMLDVATGTGDFAIMAHKRLKPGKIIGIDISTGMLNLGKKKIAKLQLTNQIELQQGDSETINFETNTFDAVTVAFGVRNFENLRKGLAEMLRVLKPGGKLVILEFSKPRQKVFKGLYNTYMNLVAPKIGKWISKDCDAYQYLNDSVKVFPEGKHLLSILEQTGYSDTYFKTLSLGICTIYCGRKGNS